MNINILGYVFLGLLAGLFGGALGLGGGSVMVPALIFFFGLTQHEAQGTSLAVMLPPVLLFAVLRYYRAGNVKLQMAVFIAIGFIIGAFLGADVVQGISDSNLKKIFGVCLMLLGIKMVLW